MFHTYESPWATPQTEKLPHGVAVRAAEKLAPEIKDIVPKNTLKIRVDQQRAFEETGGLPVGNSEKVHDHSDQVDEQTEWGAKVETNDLHDSKNLSLADNYGLPSFSNLVLENGQVIVKYLVPVETVNAAGEPVKITEEPYEVALQRHKKDLAAAPSEKIINEYLKRKQIFRTFAAVVLGAPMRGTEQTLWPKHATDKQAELERSKARTARGQGSDLIVLKGGQANVEREKASGRKKHGWKPDSYSGIFNAIGGPVDTYTQDGELVADDKTPIGIKMRELITENNLDTVMLTGTAYTHCVLDTAEGLRVMQELYKLQQGDGLAELQARFEARAGEMAGVEFSELKSLYEYYISKDMVLDPEIRIVVNITETAPVQYPGAPAEVNEGLIQGATDSYRAMGVELITDKDIATGEKVDGQGEEESVGGARAEAEMLAELESLTSELKQVLSSTKGRDAADEQYQLQNSKAPQLAEAIRGIRKKLGLNSRR